MVSNELWLLSLSSIISYMVVYISNVHVCVLVCDYVCVLLNVVYGWVRLYISV